MINSYLWCPEQDSNLHASQHSHLKRARLPFRHLGKLIVFISIKIPRLELLYETLQKSSAFNAAKVYIFFFTRNCLHILFSKDCKKRFQ